MPTSTKLQFFKYLFVGGFNFLFGLVVFYALLRLAHLNYLVAFSITWILGVLLTYIINFVWVFRPVEKLTFRSRLVKYLGVYLTSYLINIILLKVLTEHTHQDPYYLQFAIIPVVMMVNFLGMKFWSLK